MISKKCKEHLEEVGESAFCHMLHALKVSLQIQLLVFAVIVHAFIPRFFTRTATNTMKNIIKDRKNDWNRIKSSNYRDET